jgi:hypothetical protein
MGSGVSKVGFVVLVLFAMPFLGMGLFFAFMFASAAYSSGNPTGYLGAAFGLVFACVGAGLIVAAVVGYRKAKDEEKLRLTYPDSPWMWRTDWVQGRSASARKGGASVLWVLALFIDAIVFAVSYSVLNTQKFDPRFGILAVFGLIGIGLTMAAARETIRMHRFGTTWFEFTPGSLLLGDKMSGTLHLRLTIATPHGFDLRLSCIRRIVTGSGKNRSVTDEVLWSEQLNVDSTYVQRLMNDDSLLPIEFTIPGDGLETNNLNSSDQVIWLLHAQADVAGVDFKEDYEIPVFRKAGAEAAQAMSASAKSSAPTFAGVLPQQVSVPTGTKIALTQDERGTVLEFGPFRNPRNTVALLLFTTVWAGVVYFLFHKPMEGPIWFFRIAFGVTLIFLIYGLLQSIFGSTTVAVGGKVVSVTKKLLGLGRTKTYASTEILKIVTTSGGQQQGGGAATYGMRLDLGFGSKVNIANGTLTREEALWTCSVVEQALGRNDRIAVEFTPFGVMQPTAPPQGRVPNPPIAAKNSRIAMLISVAIFSFFLFSFGKTFFKMSRNAKPASSIAKQTAPAKSVSRAELSDQDMARLDTMAPQAMAEELLERSILHQDRAREVLTVKLPGMTSHIRMTDSMGKLEWRSRYSRDLRVRQANVGVNLAIAQYSVEDGAAQNLLEYGRQHPESRSSAVYYAGMLGSMQRDKAAVVDGIKEYALHDTDAKVRQWAVEGLRFFDTEKALAIEWESFTTDPSTTVRDRAGCNVSDCGIFERRMRFRYVPKLIELLDDPTQNAQMHTWAAMALAAITDANVPPNRRAWEQWYSANGAAKEAEFAALPWYQVRGDE